MMQLTAKLKYARDAKNLSQQELANQLGISRATIAEYENGLCIPTPDNLVRLADILDVPVDFFYLNFRVSSNDYIGGERAAVIEALPFGTDILSELENPHTDSPLNIICYRTISPDYTKESGTFFIFREYNINHIIRVGTDVTAGDNVLACAAGGNGRIYRVDRHADDVVLFDYSGEPVSEPIIIVGKIIESFIEPVLPYGYAGSAKH